MILINPIMESSHVRKIKTIRTRPTISTINTNKISMIPIMTIPFFNINKMTLKNPTMETSTTMSMMMT